MFWFKQNPQFIPSLVAFCVKDMKKAEPNKPGHAMLRHISSLPLSMQLYLALFHQLLP
jgi:hypothetical protein